MKAVLKFDLSEPDDAMDHLRCVKSMDLALVIWEFYYNKRRDLEDKNANVDEVFKAFSDLLDEHNVIIDELIV